MASRITNLVLLTFVLTVLAPKLTLGVGPVKLGSFVTYQHGVSGDLLAVDSKTLMLNKFSYDGQAPSAYFLVGDDDMYNLEKPATVPWNYTAIVPNDKTGCEGPLGEYKSASVKLVLPDQLTVSDITYLQVFCLQCQHNFGYVNITVPDGVEIPAAKNLTGPAGCVYEGPTEPSSGMAPVISTMLLVFGLTLAMSKKFLA